jgi:hypothetical protein
MQWSDHEASKEVVKTLKLVKLNKFESEPNQGITFSLDRASLLIKTIHTQSTFKIMPSTTSNNASEFGVYANLSSYKYEGDMKTKSANRGGDVNDMTVYKHYSKMSIRNSGSDADSTDDDDDDECSVPCNGRVYAKNIEPVYGFPTEEKLGEMVVSLPEPIDGQLLSDRKAFAPCQEPEKLTKVLMESKHGFLGRRSSIRVADSNGQPFSGGVHLKAFQHNVFRNSFLLRTARKTPVALCIQQRPAGPQIYHIYGTRPVHSNDVSRPVKERGVNYYLWFRFEEGGHRLDDRSISAWTGKGFVPIWKLVAACYHVDMDDSQPIKLNEIMIQGIEEDRALATLVKNECWEVTMAPGVDPALVFCVGAILEDSIVL